jgi:sulfonate transport system permease protein
MMGPTRAANIAKGLLLPFLLLLAWHWASGRGAESAYVFVPLSQLWDGLLELAGSGELALNVRASLVRTFTAIVIGATLGIAVGALITQSRIADRLISPLFHSIRQVPLLGLAPLLGLWVGSGDAAKLLVVVIAAFYPTVLNTSQGMRQVPLRLREVAQVLTLTRAQAFRHLLLPAAMPSILTGVAHAQAFGWLACLGAELLFSAGPGMGALLVHGEEAGRMDIVLLALLVIALLAQAMNALFQKLARGLVRGRPGE